MVNTISEGNKNRLRNKIIQGAKNYDIFLNNKKFLIICEDNSKIEINFFKEDFKHLTGINSDLSNSEFYKKAVNGTLSSANILTEQKYNWATLKGKSNRIEKIHEMLYQDADKTLLIKELVTHTNIFPYAIRNDAMNICVAFVSSINRARSLRKAGSSKDVSKEKSIIQILMKNNEDDDYKEIIYCKK